MDWKTTRTDEERAAYRLYIRTSPVWREKRRLVLVRAGGICEFEIDQGYWDGHGLITKRCTVKAAHVHHLTYDHIFDEPLEDLQALCGYHHRMAHLLDRRRECVDCGDNVFYHDQYLVADFLAWFDDPAMTLEELYDQLPRRCPGCMHFAETDGTAALLTALRS
jgi:hypothetical protein